MKIDVKDLETAMKQVKLVNAVQAEIHTEMIDGMDRLVVEFEDLSGDNVKIILASSNSGGFNYMQTRKRI